MKPKIESYIGFAKKSRGLVEGTDTCMIYLKKKKIKFVIVAEDLSNNSKEKILNVCKKDNIEIYTYFTKEKLGTLVGNYQTGIIGITDNNFAKVIKEELNKISKERGSCE